MSLPAHDYISGKAVSVLERENYALQKDTNNATKEAASASKAIAINSQVTNDQLKKLNATTLAIAQANAALVAIQTQALDESNKQTSILDAQLQIAQINELEKTRQNQIKQAAFSVEQRMIEIANESSKVSQYFYYKDELNQVDLVGLTPDSPNEITDKQYVRDILSKLHNLINAVKSEITDEQIRDVDSYYVYVGELAELKEFKRRLVDEINNTKEPKAPNMIMGILSQMFWPKFLKNPKFNIPLVVFYYILALVYFGIPLLLGAASYYLVKGKLQRSYEDALHQFEEMKINIKNAEDGIERLELFFKRFKRDYSLPV